MRKLIFYLFAILLFFVPLVLWPFTSEVFEFNKMILVYALSALIAASWAIRSILERKFIFSRTMLDTPLLVFLGSQIISTFLSIDFYTSVFGYYSRFNGGLMSTLCYSVLYWAFVSNFDRKETLKLIKITFASAFLVSIYGILEHFGIDKSLWVQDVQSRVFSTLGQPNWLAAWLTALIPITWVLAIYNLKFKIYKNNAVYMSLSILFFITLLFTKSRSGLAGFLVADVIFWGLILINKFKENLKSFVICHLIFAILSLAIGTQWSPSIGEYLNKDQNLPSEVEVKAGTALENGGTESGTIRKIVWQGALEVWQHFPVFGTGLETYAYSYYLYRPLPHNITSEWDFIYNKAHNEFLNFAANSGTIGLLSYLVLIIFAAVQIFKSGSDIRFALLAGFVSLSVSNFFGFSVVPTQLQFFLFPAFAIALSKNEEGKVKSDTAMTTTQKMTVAALLLFTFYILVLISRYWYSDILYSKAKAQNSIQRPDLAIPLLNQAVKNEPGQAIYHSELAGSYSTIAMAVSQAKEATAASEFTDLAITEIQKAVNLAPANVNLRRQMFGIYVRLSTLDEKYLVTARDSLLETIKLAPTDAKLYYNLGIANANLGETTKAVANFQKATELKPNYTDARIQYAALLVHLQKPEEAKAQLNYILEKLEPGNTTAKTALDNLR